MAHNYYWVVNLTGGGADALDAIDGAILKDKDGALANIPGDALKPYILDADSGLPESVPDVIMPDHNAGLKRWILQPVESAKGLIYDIDYKAYLVKRK